MLHSGRYFETGMSSSSFIPMLVTWFGLALGNDAVVARGRSSQLPVVHGDVVLLAQSRLVQEHNARPICCTAHYTGRGGSGEEEGDLFHSITHTLPYPADLLFSDAK